ncbi:FecR family protein [Methylococcus sp. EFPC2]|uniref:FecR family protein n=1 Tax=Methylococcus sp. EFPC2 TaxID=2812648 RepID=UPI00196785DF|nr:FecR family protein [Methylococcus sp. EFPC2]QSA96564.1 FecR family protein [Methylococcus sp. EFPC2]
MNPTIPPLPQGSPEEQAEYWSALRESPFYDAQQERLLQAWLAASQENREAWRQAQRFLHQIADLHPAQIDTVERRLGFAANTGNPVRAGRQTPGRATWPLALAASLVLALCLQWVFEAGYFADYRTATGEQRSLRLADGSQVILNTGSALSVDFSGRRRLVHLYRGEAYFKVAADADRPFTVASSGGRVTALGTAFDVRQLPDEMAVTVYEHAVSVAFADGTSVERLEAGRRIVSAGANIGLPEKADLKRASAWHEGRLVFKDQPLRAVVADLNRYRPGKIFIAGTELAEHWVTGVFETADTEASLAVIVKSLSVAELRLTDKLVILRRN